jgi:NADPH:quinone reductase-like Zn-dependent oxidoreductase
MASHPFIPPKMRAWVRTQRGPARNTLKLATDVPTPTVPTGLSSDILIRVSHVALQYNSELLMKTAPNLLFSGPWIPEIELSGEIVAAGNGVPAEVREAGTKVVAFRNVPSLPMVLGHGVLAEYVRTPASQVARVDATAVDIASASGVSCSGCTALKMIRRAGVREGHSVLVNGASGSVGSVLVQLCKLRGAKVVGVASGGNEEMVRGLGVDEVRTCETCRSQMTIYIVRCHKIIADLLLVR